ncbi:SEFIR domain protein [Geobacter metallireducens RCH3]|uniref:SEFIR domain protein n=1 Tax=Geobacter metallireducens (strain ATCC 53774 / DSM 7210 / GS-15) TaxID=269799 RepID=Q39UQ0_GEOMG|nr:tetratricopeptide repeat protein [Geobacter metallireducens]ABB32024.1 SEFIR domain protein [Geobacter metallireducens GS-15]EHP88791.1 SEFIR domain protein [Geobacter metallireducens RCH3]
MNGKRVFISYSHDSAEHRDKVLGLGACLLRDGCDCRIDLYKDTDEDWPLWMTRQLTEADFIVCVVTETYARRFNDKELPDRGLGVGWESGLIRRLLYQKKLHNDRIFPVFFDKSDDHHIPLELVGYDYFILDNHTGYETLLRKVLNRPLHLKPSIGSEPELRTSTATPLFARPSEEPQSDRIDAPAVESPLESKYHGKQRRGLLQFFVSDWLPNGPPVAIVQGFPGSGKTQLASSIVEQTPKVIVVRHEPQLETQNPSLDLLTDLALDLDYEGIPDLMQELEKGAEGDLFNALLVTLHREKILIIIDEFQRLLSPNENLPPDQWQHFFERLINAPHVAGRLLLISNRYVKRARWCEKSVSRELKGLTELESAEFLSESLALSGLTANVPSDRFVEVGRRLGGNPRAIKTLVEGLKYYPMDELISLAPRPDGTLNPELVQDFERELIERTLSRIDGGLLRFMRRLAVYRRPFRNEIYAEYTDSELPPHSLRKQLIDRYLLEFSNSGDTLHPLAREISLARLREDNEEWCLAHGLAANYYFNVFKNPQISGAKKLASSYAELRHHLFESGRIDELYQASAKLSAFAIALLPKPAQSKVPDNLETLEEHIALISALPETQRTKGLEYHLALCLKHRNIGDDLHNALKHVRRATGPHAYYAVWLLLLDLEYTINGVDAMMDAQREAIRFLGSGSNAFAVYHHCAHLLRKSDKLDDAIKLLENAVTIPGIACVTSLISLCARCMEEAGRFDDAIDFLKKGVVMTNVQELGTVYIHCAGLLARLNRMDEAITFLKEGLYVPGMTKYYSVYLLLAENLVNEGRDEEAIRLLKSGVHDSRVLDAKLMYRYVAELLVKNGRTSEAVSLLQRGIISRQVKDQLPLYHYLAELLGKNGESNTGVKILKKAMTNPRTRLEPSIYRACADLLSNAKDLDGAIEVLQKGLQEPKLKEKNQLAQKCAEMAVWQGRLDEAIAILLTRIDGNEYHNIDFIYKDCADYMVKANRIEEAISLMKRGIEVPGLTNKGVIYQKCAKLLAQVGRADEGIKLLQTAMQIPRLPGRIMLYQTCSDLLAELGQAREAIKLLKNGINGPRMGNIASLIMRCAELLAAEGRLEEAIELLLKGINNSPNDRQLSERLVKLKELYGGSPSFLDKLPTQ